MRPCILSHPPMLASFRMPQLVGPSFLSHLNWQKLGPLLCLLIITLALKTEKGLKERMGKKFSFSPPITPGGAVPVAPPPPGVGLVSMAGERGLSSRGGKCGQRLGLGAGQSLQQGREQAAGVRRADAPHPECSVKALSRLFGRVVQLTKGKARCELKRQ